MQQLEIPWAYCSCCPSPMYVFSHHLTTSMMRLNRSTSHELLKLLALRVPKNIKVNHHFESSSTQHDFGSVVLKGFKFFFTKPAWIFCGIWITLQAVHMGFTEDWASWIASNSRRTVGTPFDVVNRDETSVHLNRSQWHISTDPQYRNTQCRFFQANFLHASVPSTP